MSTDNWKHKSENMKCSTCMWYMPKTTKVGRCRKTAPTLDGWPVIFATDWCGDHKLDGDKINAEQNV